VDDRREERALGVVHLAVGRLEHGAEQTGVRELVGEVRAGDQRVERLERVGRVAHQAQVGVDEDLGDDGGREHHEIAPSVVGLLGEHALERRDHRGPRDPEVTEAAVPARRLGALLGEHDVIRLVGERLGDGGPDRRIAGAGDVALEQPDAGRG